MEIKEINVSLSAVLPNAPFANNRPGYSIMAGLKPDEDVEECINRLKKILHSQLDLDENRAKADLIERQYKNIRFRELHGKKYPSVTSILSWDTDWRVTEDELCQYASRGTIVHYLIEQFVKTGEWIDPQSDPEIKEEVDTVLSGSLKLHWNQCSHKEFFAQHGKDFEFKKTEQTVYNHELCYSGRYDYYGTYKGEPAIIDVKTGSHNFLQLSAYAACVEDPVTRLVVIPVSPTDNKSGCQRPSVTDKIDMYMKKFTQKRRAFKQRFGL